MDGGPGTVADRRAAEGWRARGAQLPPVIQKSIRKSLSVRKSTGRLAAMGNLRRNRTADRGALRQPWPVADTGLGRHTCRLTLRR